jgi:hypothetical protein
MYISCEGEHDFNAEDVKFVQIQAIVIVSRIIKPSLFRIHTRIRMCEILVRSALGCWWITDSKRTNERRLIISKNAFREDRGIQCYRW